MAARLRKHLSLIIFYFIIFKRAFSQTENIGGFINIYAKVVEISYPCNAVEIANSTGSFEADDLVIIIQMKGASTSRTANVSYGDITAYGNAGNYEWNIIESVSGSFITFKNQLLRSYDIPGLVQIVKVPVYENANTVSTLRAMNWNGEIGGVLALVVNQNFTLNDSVSVIGSGFRGGEVNVNGGGSCFNNIFEGARTNANIAGRGESIAVFTPNNEHGRGKQANGGGGGGGNNTGGGGGGNGGTGGRSGRQSSPGCTFDGPFALGGTSLAYTLINNRVFLGGGGGGGHQNNFTNNGPPANPGSTPGAAGGGIIFIKANQIINNGPGIFADADIVKNSPAWGDGAGGGAAGGNIVLDIQNFTNPITVSVKGSDGGNAIDFTGRNMGTGGGGGGGVLWLSSPTIPANLTTNVNGGKAGITSVCNCVHGAVDGGDGLILLNHSKPESNTPLDLSACLLRFIHEKDKNQKESSFIFPNPFNEVIMVKTSFEIISLKMISIDGKELIVDWKKTDEGIEINTKNIQNGLYVLKMWTAEKVFSQKVIK